MTSSMFLKTQMMVLKRSLLIFQRWVRAYRHTISIHTTNGVERQNEELKYNFLASHRDKSLSGLISVLITEFFPDKYARYDNSYEAQASFRKNKFRKSTYRNSIYQCQPKSRRDEKNEKTKVEDVKTKNEITMILCPFQNQQHFPQKH